MYGAGKKIIRVVGCCEAWLSQNPKRGISRLYLGRECKKKWGSDSQGGEGTQSEKNPDTGGLKEGINMICRLPQMMVSKSKHKECARNRIITNVR